VNCPQSAIIMPKTS